MVDKCVWIAVGFICSLVLLLPSMVSGQSEDVYIYEINTELGGQVEVSVPSGRVDILTKTHAFEVERAANWKEAIGQALWYGLQTDRMAGIVLVKSTAAEFKYVQQLQSTIDHSGLTDRIYVMVYPDDFPLAARAHQYEEQPIKLHALDSDGTTTNARSTIGKTDFWLTTSSKRRHNKDCNVYEKSKGRYCQPSEGIAAGCCGG